MTTFHSLYLDHIREQNPLTNIVATNLSANSLLAIGASPLMANEQIEMADVVKLSHTLVINIRLLSSLQILPSFTPLVLVV